MISKTLHSSDGTALHTVHAPAVGETKAHVVLCHGANEHVGRYGHVIESLNKAGFAVTGLDLRGHGKSGGKRCHVLRWEHYSEDIRVVIQSVGGPVFVLGHSMGGLVVLEAIRSGINGTEIKGVMTSNPLLDWPLPHQESKRPSQSCSLRWSQDCSWGMKSTPIILAMTKP